MCLECALVSLLLLHHHSRCSAAHLCTQHHAAVGHYVWHPYLREYQGVSAAIAAVLTCKGFQAVMARGKLLCALACTRAPLLQLASFKLSSKSALDNRCLTSTGTGCPPGSAAFAACIASYRRAFIRMIKKKLMKRREANKCPARPCESERCCGAKAAQ